MHLTGPMAEFRLFIVLLLLPFFPLLSAGQKGVEDFRKGYQAHREGAYEKAIRHYSLAIKANDSLKKAYYNRASVRIALDRYARAKRDLDRALQLDQDYLPAYYNRANIHSELENYQKAHADLNAVLKRDPEHRKALLLRGQVRQHLGKSKAGCRDLKKAKRSGSSRAAKYIEQYCGKAPLDLEARWPSRTDWKVVRRNEDKDLKRVELVPKEESFPEWEHLGSVMALKHVRDIPMDTARLFLKRQAKGKCKDVKAHTIEKRDQGSAPYIIFTLRCSSHINTQEPETQLWYVEQGARHLYAWFVAVRKKQMSQKEQERWKAFLKDR